MFCMHRRVHTYRDVFVYELNGEVLVVGCDSAGGIGPKPLDTVKVSGYILGRYTARVALMEVLSTGAKPICVINTSCVEPEPLGREVLRGVREEAKEAGLTHSSVRGSSEKNFKVQQTATGVTVVGVTQRDHLRIGISQKGDEVLAFGKPHFGEEVISQRKETADLHDLLTLLEIDSIHEIIPVGSMGILHEAATIARDCKLRFKPISSPRIELNKSAGPATVFLATARETSIQALKTVIRKPLCIVGHLY